MAVRVSYFILQFLFSFYSGKGQGTELRKLETSSTYSDYGHFNPVNNKLVYYGMNADSGGRIFNSSISVLDISHGKEVILDTRIVYPAIGWVDSSKILQYRTFPERPKTKPRRLFDNEYERSLFMVDIFSGEKTLIDSIPLKQSLNKMVVDGFDIVYQNHTFKKTELYKYNILTKKTREFVALRHLDIGDTNFAYRSRDSLLAYAMNDGSVFNIRLLSGNRNVLVESSEVNMTVLSFDFFSDRLFYAVRDAQDRLRVILKSFDTITGEKKTIYEFDAGVFLIRVSPFTRNKLILSVIGSSETPSIQTVELGSKKLNFISSNVSRLFILTMEN